MRIRGFPFGEAVSRFLTEHQRVFVVEQNRDAQLRALLTLETGAPRDSMIAVLDYGGVPLSAGPIVQRVMTECGSPVESSRVQAGHPHSAVASPL
jgi:2-oxoglutarate ferredoxin oxidoreductase subunit alpha